MFRKSGSFSGLKETTLVAALLAVVSGSLAGCGTDMATNPGQLSISEDQPGEVPAPIRDFKLPTPWGFGAEILNGTTVQLTWAAPSIGYRTLVFLDGIQIAAVDARDGSYLDTMGKPEGDHVYAIAFSNGTQVSRDVKAGVTIMAGSDDTGPNRDNGRRGEQN